MVDILPFVYMTTILIADYFLSCTPFGNGYTLNEVASKGKKFFPFKDLY